MTPLKLLLKRTKWKHRSGLLIKVFVQEILDEQQQMINKTIQWITTRLFFLFLFTESARQTIEYIRVVQLTQAAFSTSQIKFANDPAAREYYW